MSALYICVMCLYAQCSVKMSCEKISYGKLQKWLPWSLWPCVLSLLSHFDGLTVAFSVVYRAWLNRVSLSRVALSILRTLAQMSLAIKRQLFIKGMQPASLTKPQTVLFLVVHISLHAKWPPAEPTWSLPLYLVISDTWPSECSVPMRKRQHS